LVLSHGHSNHTGGLRDFLRRRNKEIEIIAHPDVFALKYGRRKGESYHFSGIPFRKEELESRGAKFAMTAEPVKISENILTIRPSPRLRNSIFSSLGYPIAPG